MNKTKNENRGKEERELENQKTALPDFDLAVPGTIRRIFLKCGKDGCACRKDKSARHGPYHLWDRKVGGKLSSMSVDAKDLPLLKRWIGNRMTLEKRIAEVLRLSQSLAALRIEQQRTKRKKS
jgi:hypothetical protein